MCARFFAALLLTAVTYVCIVCLFFKKWYILGDAVEHSEEKRDAKLTQAMCVFKNLTVTFVFVSPVESTIVFLPARHTLHNSL